MTPYPYSKSKKDPEMEKHRRDIDKYLTASAEFMAAVNECQKKRSGKDIEENE